MKVVNLKHINAGKLKAFFDLELDNGIVIKGFKIAEGPTGVFVGCPSEKDKEGKYWDKVFLPNEIKNEVSELAFEVYGNPAPKSDPKGDLPF